MAAVIEIKYFNTFILKKVFPPPTTVFPIVPFPSGSPGFNPVPPSPTPIWGGSFGVPKIINGNNVGHPQDNVAVNPYEWAIEESRIQGGFNNLSVDFGAKAYLVDNNNTASIRSTSLIYSGVFNSRTGVNDTNQFPGAEEITKSLDPNGGTIQKLYAEDTNLIVFQENKVSRALINKDAVYSAEGAGSLTSSNVVIGQIIAYAGVYGISKDPGSFAVYGYRKYFTDRNRNAVLRLSQDGITEISEAGMSGYFRNEFSKIDSILNVNGIDTNNSGRVVGGWDSHNKQYIISTQSPSDVPLALQRNATLGFSEEVLGFTSFYSYIPSQIISVKNKFYTINKGILYLHYDTSPNTRAKFYNTTYTSAIRFVFNQEPSNVKVFKTINYEGSSGWEVVSFKSDLTGMDLFNANYINTQDIVGALSGILTQPAVFSYVKGAYDDYGNSYPTTLYPPINRAGFDRKENKYMAVLINKSEPNQGEIIYGNEMTGIKGYFAVVDMSLDNTTEVGGAKELFAASSNYDSSVQ